MYIYIHIYQHKLPWIPINLQPLLVSRVARFLKALFHSRAAALGFPTHVFSEDPWDKNLHCRRHHFVLRQVKIKNVAPQFKDCFQGLEHGTAHYPKKNNTRHSTHLVFRNRANSAWFSIFCSDWWLISLFSTSSPKILRILRQKQQPLITPASRSMAFHGVPWLLRRTTSSEVHNFLRWASCESILALSDEMGIKS